jgi:CRP/FNR family cyclic AMP-dependent transcriptional regulator
MAAQSVDPRVRQQLAGHPFVRGLEPRFIDALGARGHLVEFEPREVIFREGDPADTFYLVRSGIVALQVDAGEPFPQAIQHINEGSALGWSWLFPPYEWQFDAVAQTPVRAMAFDAAALREEFEADPFFGYHIMGKVAELMVKRLHATRHQLIHASR